MKKTVLLTVVMVFVLTTMVFASGSQESDASNATGSEKYAGKMAWYYPFPHPFGEACKEGIDAYVTDTGIDVAVRIGPEFTIESQLANLEALRAKGYNVFSTFSVDGAAVNGLYEEFVAGGAIVNNVGWDSGRPNKASTLISTNIENSAAEAMEYLAEKMNYKGNIMTLYGDITTTTFTDRLNGVNSVFKKYPDLNLEIELNNMLTNEDALIKIDDALTANYDDIDGIISLGFNISTALCQIMDEKLAAGAKKIPIILIDMDAIIEKAIRDGIVSATVVQNPYGIGYISGKVMTLQSDGYTTRSGVYHIDTGIVIVEKHNIDSYEDDIKKRTMEIVDSLTTEYLEKK